MNKELGIKNKKILFTFKIQSSHFLSSYFFILTSFLLLPLTQGHVNCHLLRSPQDLQFHILSGNIVIDYF